MLSWKWGPKVQNFKKLEEDMLFIQVHWIIIVIYIYITDIFILYYWVLFIFVFFFCHIQVTYPTPPQHASWSLDDLPRTLACTINQGSNVTSMDFHPLHHTLLLGMNCQSCVSAVQHLPHFIVFWFSGSFL